MRRRKVQAMGSKIPRSNQRAPETRHENSLPSQERQNRSSNSGFFIHDAAARGSGRGRNDGSPAGLISVFAKVGLHRRRPLTDWERDWLNRWFRQTPYFKAHRRLSRGLAKKLCIEMDADRGQVTDDRGGTPVNVVRTRQTETEVDPEQAASGRRPASVIASAGACPP